MKKIFLSVLLLASIKIACAQSNINLKISKASQIIGSKTVIVEAFLDNGGYRFTEKSNNFYSYVKSNDGIGYELTIAYRNSSVSALSWDELIINLSKIKGEIASLGFNAKSENTLGNKAIENYENIKKNLSITLIVQNSSVRINMGLVNFSALKAINNITTLNNSLSDVSYWLSPKSNSSKILSKPNQRNIHPEWKGSGIGLSWGFKARKKIVNDLGIFYSGDIITSRGSVYGKGPDYILASEWDILK